MLLLLDPPTTADATIASRASTTREATTATGADTSADPNAT